MTRTLNELKTALSSVGLDQEADGLTTTIADLEWQRAELTNTRRT